MSPITTFQQALQFDWNNDGDFDDPADAVYVVPVSVNGPTMVTVPVNVPCSYDYNDPIDFRVRVLDIIAPADVGLAEGLLVNGEVEDYQFVVTATAVTLSAIETAAPPGALSSAILLTLIALIGITILLLRRRQL